MWKQTWSDTASTGDSATSDSGTPPTPTDADGDGFDMDVDCDDQNATVYPGAAALCDGIQNNCDLPWQLSDEDGLVTHFDTDGSPTDLSGVFLAATLEPSEAIALMEGATRVCPGTYEVRLLAPATVVATVESREGLAPDAVVFSPVAGTGMTVLGHLSLNNLTVSNATNSGVRVEPGATFDAFNVLFTNNTATTGGGLDVSGAATLTDCDFLNNSVTGWGGGIALMDHGDLTMLRGSLTENTASRGGGVSILAGVATFTNVHVASNTASTAGGGVYSSEDVRTTMVDCTVEGNVAVDGGGVVVGGGTTEIYSTIVSGNQADNGGGFWNDGGGLTIEDGHISNNEALRNGGGLWVDGRTTVIGTSVSENTAVEDGGGAYTTDNSPFDPTCDGGPTSTGGFFANVANRGGAVFVTSEARFESVGCDFDGAGDGNSPNDIETSTGATMDYGDDALFVCLGNGCQ